MEINFILTKLNYVIYLIDIENYLIVEKSNRLSSLQCWTATERHNNACEQGTGD